MFHLARRSTAMKTCSTHAGPVLLEAPQHRRNKTTFRASLLAAAAVVVLSASAIETGARARTLHAVGLALASVDDPFFKALVEGVTTQAKSINPGVRIDLVAAGHAANRQLVQIDDLVASGIDVIILNAVDADAVRPAIERARKAGVAVVAVHVAAPGANAAVLSDDVAAGRLSCQALARRIGGKGSVVIESGPQRVAAVGERIRGCKQALGVDAGITLLSPDPDGKGTRAGGLAVTRDVLAREPSLAGLFTISEPEAMGAQAAVDESHRPGIVITTVGGAPDFVSALRAPGAAVAATAALDPYAMGELAMQDAALILEGSKPAQRVTLMVPKLVDRDDVTAYRGWARH